MCDVAFRLRVRPHPIIHGWHQQYLRLRRKQTRREQVVGEAMRRSSHEIRRRGSHNDHVGFAGEPDVIECVSGSEISEWTGRPVTASNVIGPTNSRAPRVITTSTSAPACVSKRASHTDL